MNIAIIVEQLAKVSGTSIHVAHSARALSELGHNVRVVSLGTLNSTLNIGRATHVSAGRLPSHILDGKHTFPQLVTCLKEVAISEQIDFIHCHYPYASLAGAMVKLELGIPFAITMHGYELRSSLVRVDQLEAFAKASRLADTIIYVSNAIKQQTERLCGSELGVSRIIADGVAPQFWRELELTSKDSKGILYVGRLSDEKGVLDLAEAFIDYVKSGGKLHLTIAGDGQSRESLEEAFSISGVAKKVEFLGELDQKDLSIHYQSAAFTVVPSHVEALGTVALESLASGTPVLATDAGGLGEVISHGENGLIVPIGSIAEMTRGMETLTYDQELLSKLTGNARQSVAHFNWESIAQELESCYAVIHDRINRARAETLCRIEGEFGDRAHLAWQGAEWDKMNG